MSSVEYDTKQHLEKMAQLGEDDDGLRDRALEDLVSQVMCNRNYPKWGNRQICLPTILEECPQNELVDAILDQLSDDPRRSLTSLVEDIATDYLRDTHWHESRVDDLREEEREAALESKHDAADAAKERNEEK